MAFYIGWTEKLQATRLWLQDVKTGMDPRNYGKLTGTLNFLFSPLAGNVIRTTMMNNAGNSEYRPVEIRYVPRKGTQSLTTSDASATCTAVNQRRDIIDIHQPTLYVEDKFTIQENYVRENAENGYGLQQRLQGEFMDAMRVCREDMNRQLLAKAATLMGSNPAQTANKGVYTSVAVVKTASGQIDDRYWDVFKNDQEDNLVAGEIGIIGLGNSRRYFNRLAVGAANDGGVDYMEVARQFGMVLFKDHTAEGTLGDSDRVLALYPGAAQFYQYSLNRGADFAINEDTFVKGTMPDPVYPGLLWDYILKYDDGCTGGNGLQGGWTARVFTHFDLWTVPEGAAGEPYGELVDFNGIVGYKITEA